MLLISIVSFNIIYSQQTLSGVVKDATINQPIFGATVYFPELEKGATTNIDGNFTVENLPNGVFKLIVSYLGYETYSTTVNTQTDTTLTILLTPSPIEIKEVVVSTPFHKLQSENVMKVERASVESLKSKGGITLADGINNIPGVSTITTGTGIAKPVIRGLSANRVLVYTQGVRLENQQYGQEHGLGLSDAGVESVEVIKGPASLLYGSDALGGVLYLSPEKFANANTYEADVSAKYFSNTQGFNSSAGYKSSSDAFKFLFRGSVSEHSDYKTANERVTNTRYKEQDFKAGIGYQSTKFKTDFRYNTNLSKIGIPEEIADQTTSRKITSPYQDLANHVLSSKTMLFFNNSSLEVNLGFVYNDRKEFEEHHHGHDHDDEDHHDDEHEDEEHEDEDEEHHDDDEHHDEEHEEHEEGEAALHMKLKTFNYDVKYKLPKIGKTETIVGVQGMNQTNTNYGEEILIPDATTNDFGAFITSHIHFSTLDLQLGVRFDNRQIDVENSFSKNYNSFNGALGVKTNISKNVVTRLNLATGFRAPNLSELTSDGVHHGTNRYEIGNSDLNTEQNFQADLNIEFANKHVEFYVNGFYNNVKNYIYLEPTGTEINEAPVFNYVQDDAYLYGGEIGLHIHPHPLDWLHLESSFETVTGKLQNDEYLPLIPANSLTNTLRIEYSTSNIKQGYAFVSVQSVFDQNNVSEFETTTPGYSLLSAGIGGTIKLFSKDVTLTVAGNNLTNKTYINHLSRLKPDGIANMGRNISFGLSTNL